VDITRVDFGLVNHATGGMGGVQLGLLNMTETLKGLQIGLANIIQKDGIPFLPIANWRFQPFPAAQ